ncbi:hypothetical protein AURANDRAFT_68414 [Aureococcus anophagefferens]|uniref:Beta-ketoacyl synthase C-terminal domain-containing protein n=1 Tax=Aureococcus anophagefferens TaxID=44056 RepID=F0YPK4_AURAN|nr:hypothetical protein AURANDRAFT_68414 [Aureococcus anophagefferens]EGB02956.1 hypothetical protein AURANDRAFT_68414 [Aureococcus anophagefferens]|eukprot:XP_009042346.1 hypothetical protein AURANDRAFT_68414 [Aureococcus anophagefferens]
MNISTGLLEAHGTGTLLGDPIEVGSTVKALSQTLLMIGVFISSVKANMGHLEAAAAGVGILSLIATCLEATTKAPNGQLLSHLSMTCLHCQINVEPMMGIAHSRTSMGRFSAFGFSGTIAHGCFTTISSSRSKTNIRGAFSFHRYQRRNHGEKHVDASEPSTEDDTSFLDMGVHSRCLV